LEIAGHGHDGFVRTTVVIATRNGGTRLLRTLRRLEGLSPAPPIIVVDNASDDGTPALISQTHPNVSVIRIGSNLGAYGRNLGVAKAKTPYVAFADDDSWWSVEAIERAESLMDASPSIGLIAGTVMVGDREDPVCTPMRHSPLRNAQLPGPVVLGFVACGAIVRREAYLKVGGFHPVLHFFGEESLLAQDLATAGWSSVYVDSVIAHHAPDSGVDRSGRRALGLRNALLTSWMRRPVHVALARTFTLLRIADNEARIALIQAFKRLPAALRSRRLLPSHVEEQVALVESAEVRPHLQIVPPIGAHLRTAQNALEVKARLFKNSLFTDVRDVG
jgi:GT2 family glycosyltransferase